MARGGNLAKGGSNGMSFPEFEDAPPCSVCGMDDDENPVGLERGEAQAGLDAVVVVCVEPSPT